MLRESEGKGDGGKKGGADNLNNEKNLRDGVEGVHQIINFIIIIITVFVERMGDEEDGQQTDEILKKKKKKKK